MTEKSKESMVKLLVRLWAVFNSETREQAERRAQKAVELMEEMEKDR